MFLSQFKDPLVITPIAAAVVSMLTGDPGGAMVIFAVLLLNTVLGMVQHRKTEKSLDNLKQLSSPKARVMREGLLCIIPSPMVAPGDILILEADGLVATGGRLLGIHGSTVDGNSLTRESLGMEKHTRGIKGQDDAVTLADRTNMVFSDSLVTSGRAMAVVTVTGTGTEIGEVVPPMNDTEKQGTPPQVSLDRFSGRLAIATITIRGLIFLLSLYRREPVLDAFMSAMTLAVTATLKALSSIVTIVQAMGTQKMAKEQATIKDLKAVESLRYVSVIYSNKTGTLTQNRTDVGRVYVNHTEQEVRWLEENKARTDAKMPLCGAILNNNASAGSSQDEGDPMEIALLHVARGAGMILEWVRTIDPRGREIPFDSARKLMTTVDEVEDTGLIFAEGVVDVFLKKCIRLASPASSFPDGEGGMGMGLSNPGGGTSGGLMETPSPVPSRILSSPDRQKVMNQDGPWSPESLRVLVLACRPYQSTKKSREEEEPISLGLVTMMDPPRPESRSAVTNAHQVGIHPMMIAGDHKVIAMAIAERIGILSPGDMAATGAELDQMGDEDLSHRLEHISVYIRVPPEHKICIVNARQGREHIMAITDDGVNNAPALEKADIGVAMGTTGTEVSRGAASMILTNDNFVIIIKAVTDGGNAYRSIKNAVQFLLSGNMVGIPRVLYASLLALPLSFMSIYLLFINPITDPLSTIAIGTEPPEEGLLKEPPRNPKEGILTMSSIQDILVQGGPTAAVTMWAHTTGFHEGGPGRACTMVLSTLTLARSSHGFNYGNAHSIIRLGLGSSLYSVMAFQLGVVPLAAVLLVPGLQIIFTVVGLSLSQLSIIAAAASLPTLAIQVHKILKGSIS